MYKTLQFISNDNGKINGTHGAKFFLFQESHTANSTRFPSPIRMFNMI